MEYFYFSLIIIAPLLVALIVYIRLDNLYSYDVRAIVLTEEGKVKEETIKVTLNQDITNIHSQYRLNKIFGEFFEIFFKASGYHEDFQIEFIEPKLIKKFKGKIDE